MGRNVQAVCTTSARKVMAPQLRRGEVPSRPSGGGVTRACIQWLSPRDEPNDELPIQWTAARGCPVVGRWSGVVPLLYSPTLRLARPLSARVTAAGRTARRHRRAYPRRPRPPPPPRSAATRGRPRRCPGRVGGEGADVGRHTTAEVSDLDDRDPGRVQAGRPDDRPLHRARHHPVALNERPHGRDLGVHQRRHHQRRDTGEPTARTRSETPSSRAATSAAEGAGPTSTSSRAGSPGRRGRPTWSGGSTPAIAATCSRARACHGVVRTRPHHVLRLSRRLHRTSDGDVDRVHRGRRGSAP